MRINLFFGSSGKARQRWYLRVLIQICYRIGEEVQI